MMALPLVISSEHHCSSHQKREEENTKFLVSEGNRNTKNNGEGFFS
jgi:hypothetical protein